MVIIDVRTKSEYEGGHIENAINFDIMDMMYGRYPDIDPKEEIWVYCQSGNRSMMSKNMMEDAGFTNIVDKGGINNLR